MIIIPEDVERMVKKLKKHPKIESPWALAQWMKKQGYKMPSKKKAEEEKQTTQKTLDNLKIIPPTPKPKGPLKLKKVAEEGIPRGLSLEAPSLVKKHKTDKGLSQVFKPGKGEKSPLLAEEKKKVPGKNFPKTREYLKERGLVAEEEPKKRDYSVWLREKEEKKKSPFKKLFGNDMEFDPKEIEMGMKEEREHDDITGGNEEMVKKIVIAHLKENPQYYTKLKSVMKASEEEKEEVNYKDLDEKGILKLFKFMQWLVESGTKIPEGDGEKFEELMNRFEVEHLAQEGEQMMKKPEYDAEEYDSPLGKKPKLQTDTAPPLIKRQYKPDPWAKKQKVM